MDFIVKHDPASKSHIRQDLLGNTYKKYGRVFQMIDAELLLTTELSGSAKIIFAIIRATDRDKTPNREYFRSLTGYGKTVIRDAINELEAKGMIFVRSVPYAGARREIYDVMPMENWTWLTLQSDELIEEQSVRNQPDPENYVETSVLNRTDPQLQSVRNQPDQISGRAENSPTDLWVGPKSARPDPANPYPSTVSGPLLDYKKEEEYKYKKGREGEAEIIPFPSPVEARSIFAKSKRDNSWVSIAKQIQESFENDKDWVYDVLNPWVKASTSSTEELALFADFLVQERIKAREGRKFQANRNNLIVMWNYFRDKTSAISREG